MPTLLPSRCHTVHYQLNDHETSSQKQTRLSFLSAGAVVCEVHQHARLERAHRLANDALEHGGRQNAVLWKGFSTFDCFEELLLWSFIWLCFSMALDSRSVGCGCRHFSLFKANCTGISLHYDHGANSISSGACSERIRCTCGDRWRAKRVIRSYRLPLTSTARPLDTITVAIGPSGA
jgi:hypothetical protein